MVDAANGFSNLNRKVVLQSIKFICPEIAAYVNNFYSILSRLFVCGSLELTSREGLTHGDPLSMAIYFIGIILMLNMMLTAMQHDHNKMVEFADDVTTSGNFEALRRW